MPGSIGRREPWEEESLFPRSRRHRSSITTSNWQNLPRNITSSHEPRILHLDKVSRAIGTRLRLFSSKEHETAFARLSMPLANYFPRGASFFARFVDPSRPRERNFRPRFGFAALFGANSHSQSSIDR